MWMYSAYRSFSAGNSEFGSAEMKLRNADGLRRNWPSLSAKSCVGGFYILVNSLLLVLTPVVFNSLFHDMNGAVSSE
jgi:hypothetical protein